MARRAWGSLTAVALTTAVVGCGSGGDPSALASATNQACERVSTAAQLLSVELVRGPGSDEVSAVRAAVDRYAGTVRSAATELERASAPKADREFQRLAVARLQQHADQLRAAARPARDGQLRSSAIERLSAPAAAEPLIPPAILDDAPACGTAAR